VEKLRGDRNAISRKLGVKTRNCMSKCHILQCVKNLKYEPPHSLSSPHNYRMYSRSRMFGYGWKCDRLVVENKKTNLQKNFFSFFPRFVYKLPQLPDNPDPIISSGYDYAYLDPSSQTLLVNSNILQHLSHISQVQGKRLDDAEGSIDKTLNQIYNDKSWNYIFWNGSISPPSLPSQTPLPDETPDDHKTESKAHAKGVLGVLPNADAGFLLRHSTPRWPPYVKDGYVFPEMEKEYGQTFLCMSMDGKTLDDVAYQYRVNGPQVYDYYTADVDAVYQNISQLGQEKFVDVSWSVGLLFFDCFFFFFRGLGGTSDDGI